MKEGPSLLIAMTAAVLCFAVQSPRAEAAESKPPVAKVQPVTETFFGTPVTDNYRYMEKLQDPYVAAM